jgi:hypothetical protein
MNREIADGEVFTSGRELESRCVMETRLTP